MWKDWIKPTFSGKIPPGKFKETDPWCNRWHVLTYKDKNNIPIAKQMWFTPATVAVRYKSNADSTVYWILVNGWSKRIVSWVWLPVFKPMNNLFSFWQCADYTSSKQELQHLKQDSGDHRKNICILLLFVAQEYLFFSVVFLIWVALFLPAMLIMQVVHSTSEDSVTWGKKENSKFH